MNYFVTGIDTDSGKTLACAILCEALKADYWKPIQAGLPRDTETVRNLVENSTSVFHPEAYLLQTPASPHAAAKIDGISISLDNIKQPQTTNKLIIEGAGGCLVPINDQDFVIDIAKKIKCEIILVADLYLGSINHTLLTVHELKRRGLPIKGLIFNGVRNSESERIILKHTGWPLLVHIEKEMVVSKEIIKQYASKLLDNWND
jgi:dethiobiotin synthetase